MSSSQRKFHCRCGTKWFCLGLLLETLAMVPAVPADEASASPDIPQLLKRLNEAGLPDLTDASCRHTQKTLHGETEYGSFSGEPVEAQFLMAIIPRMAKPSHGWNRRNYDWDCRLMTAVIFPFFMCLIHPWVGFAIRGIPYVWRPNPVPDASYSSAILSVRQRLVSRALFFWNGHRETDTGRGLRALYLVGAGTSTARGSYVHRIWLDFTRQLKVKRASRPARADMAAETTANLKASNQILWT